MAGYSEKSLCDKLGIKPGYKVYVNNVCENYFHELGRLPEGVNLAKNLRGQFDFIHFFTKNVKDLKLRLPVFKKAMKQDAMIWVSWPKKSSKMSTDLNENIIRNIALDNGLVDVKVCAVDEIWSGLKLVIRLKDRHS